MYKVLAQIKEHAPVKLIYTCEQETDAQKEVAYWQHQLASDVLKVWYEAVPVLAEMSPDYDRN